MPKLVKDFQNYQFFFYWYEKDAGRLSPVMPTLNHAQEWLQRWLNEQYKGAERRVNSRSTVYNRRTSDKAVHIDLDLSEKKLRELKDSFTA